MIVIVLVVANVPSISQLNGGSCLKQCLILSGNDTKTPSEELPHNALFTLEMLMYVSVPRPSAVVLRTLCFGDFVVPIIVWSLG